MNKVLLVLAAAMVSGTAFAGTSDGTSSWPMMSGADLKAIDANGDGMISRDEFMKHHEAMWARMKKGRNGMVDITEMEAMHGGAMTGEGMARTEPMKRDKQPKDPAPGK